ncbi:MAG: tyrosine--tRNA ligase [bacterium]|nr:tyrosine--tRNA ligase [bacterium]
MNSDIILNRGVEEIIERDHLEKKMAQKERLRVKLGIDPTASDLHLGHTVVLRKLKQFQEAGHQAILLIGDFTALVGDPSGKNEQRPQLTNEQVQENMKNYLQQAGLVLDLSKTEVRYNSEWYKDKGMDFFIDLTSKFTVARSLERDDFQKRLKENQDVSLLEVLYPILQGYDSVALKADVELGGTDQKFNLLTGRKVQKRYGEIPQDIITLPLIEGLDGIKKMSKSLGNYIGLTEKPQDMFNKIMSLSDQLMVKYFTLITDVSEQEIEKLKAEQANPSDYAPKEWKEKLATEIVRMYHGPEQARKTQEEFTRVFSNKELPTEIQEISIGADALSIIDLMTQWLGVSKTEAKNLVNQKAVQINDEVVTDWNTDVKIGDIIRSGPRRFVKVVN